MIPEERELPKVLLVTDVIFWNRGRGSAQRIQTMFEHLVTYCQVTVCFIGEISIEDWNQAAAQLNCELIGPGKPGKLASVVIEQVSRLKIKSTDLPQTQESRQQVTLADFRSDLISEYVYRHVQQHHTDVVLLQYVTLGYLCERLRDLDEPPLLMIDTHDLMHLRCLAFESKGLEHWLHIDRDEEIANLKNADVMLAIQEHEAETLRKLLPERRVCLAKHAVVADTSVTRTRRPANAEFVVGFVGSQGTANLNSLGEFLINCWPKIRKKCDRQICLRIGGDLSAANFDAADRYATAVLDGVEFSGLFGDPAEFYEQIDLAINPAQIASGMKVKSLQALSYSVPLVATPAGIAGLETAAGICALVADDWEQFTNHVHDLFSDPDRLDAYSDNCVSFLAEEFHPEVVFADLKQAILDIQ